MEIINSSIKSIKLHIPWKNLTKDVIIIYHLSRLNCKLMILNWCLIIFSKIR